ADDCGVASCVTGRIFERQTRPLREPEQTDPIGGDSFAGEVAHEAVERRKRSTQVRFVLLDGREERERIPGPPRRLGDNVSHIVQGERLRNPRHAVRGSTAAVDEDHREPRAGGRRTEAQRAHRVRAGSCSGGNASSIAARLGSSHGGRTSVSPRCDGSSSTANPGPWVAISKSTPPGSRKYTDLNQKRSITGVGSLPADWIRARIASSWASSATRQAR